MSNVQRRRSKTQKRPRLQRIKFDFAGEPLSSATISRFAYELDLTDDYQRLLRKTNGGSPNPADFSWEHPKNGTQQSHVDQFLGIDNRPFGPDRRTDCLSVTLRYRDHLPRYALPIGFANRDDLLLTFAWGKRRGQIWLLLWNPPLIDEPYDPEETVFYLADSLPEFLNSLTTTDDPYDPLTLALDAPKVRGKQLEALLKSLGCKPFKYKGVRSQTALPPAWEWPKFRRADDDSPAFLSVEKNHTYGFAPKCNERPKGHKMLRVNVTQSQRKQCLKELMQKLGDHVELVNA